MNSKDQERDKWNRVCRAMDSIVMVHQSEPPASRRIPIDDTRSADMLSLYINDGLTLIEVGHSFGISRERVRQLIGGNPSYVAFRDIRAKRKSIDLRIKRRIKADILYFSKSQLFFKNVPSSNKNGCQIWTGFINQTTGYAYSNIPYFSRSLNTSNYAHRLAWALQNGPIPDGLHILHTCDNRPCVNPDHLYSGTHQDNIQDREDRKRTARGETSGTNKLSAREVRKIRQTYAQGNITYAELSRRNGVCYQTIISIVKRNSWKHIQ